jgi:glucosamine kinase
MILLADSGSSKTEWILIENNQEIHRTETMGLNPFFVDEGSIRATIEHSSLAPFVKQIQVLHFYGAGCSNEEKVTWLKTVFQKSFVKATIEIFTDIDGAVLACSEGKPAIVCILGTGSTFRIFDGEKIIRKYSSLAYIIGDEGSGTYIAKSLLRGIFYQNFSQDLQNKFFEKYPINSDILLEKVYKQNQANKYLASFVPFCKENISDPSIEALVLNAFEQFYLEHLAKFPESKTYPIHFVGSVAFHFEEQLKKIASKYQFTVGKILQKPLEALSQSYYSL